MMVLSKKQKVQRNEILESIYTHGRLSRAELSRLLTITPATMTEVAGYLISDGILRESGQQVNALKAGRKNILLEISPGYSYYVGVELSEHKIRICLTDNLGQYQESEVIAREINADFLLSEKNVVYLIHEFLNKNKNYDIEAIGIAVPGHYHKESQQIISNNALWASFNLSEIISSFAIPVYIKNNVKCMALAELYLDKQKNKRNFLFLSLKRGIFAAYVYNGKIYGDENYLVGEIGHVVVNPNGEQCECGKAGCLQTYIGVSWILKKARFAYESGRTKYLELLVDKSADITISHVFLAYRMGDEFIHKIIEQGIDYLALQVNNSLMMLDIEVVYIHGKLFEEPLIADKLSSKLENSQFIIEQNKRILRQVLPYDSLRGSIGACALAIKNHLIDRNEEVV